MNTLVIAVEASTDVTALWALLVGGVTPFLIAVVNRPTWSVQKRQTIAAIVSILVGVVTVVVGGTISDWSLTTSNIAVIIAAVVGASQVTYALIWKPTNIALNIEQATTPAPKA